jgi:hypothetical protein
MGVSDTGRSKHIMKVIKGGTIKTTAYDYIGSDEEVKAIKNAVVRMDKFGTVWATGRSEVRVDDNAICHAKDNATVYAYGNAQVIAHNNVTVYACDNVNVVAFDNVKVNIDTPNVQVTLLNKATLHKHLYKPNLRGRSWSRWGTGNRAKGV